MIKKHVALLMSAILILVLSSCFMQENKNVHVSDSIRINEQDTSKVSSTLTNPTGNLNYNGEFIIEEKLGGIINTHNTESSFDLGKLEQMKIANDGVHYFTAQARVDEIIELLNRILDLEVSETRDRFDELQRKDIIFQDKYSRDGPFVRITYNNEEDVYFIDGDFPPKSLVDPSRTFRVQDAQQAKNILDLCDKLMENEA